MKALFIGDSYAAGCSVENNKAVMIPSWVDQVVKNFGLHEGSTASGGNLKNQLSTLDDKYVIKDKNGVENTAWRNAVPGSGYYSNPLNKSFVDLLKDAKSKLNDISFEITHIVVGGGGNDCRSNYDANQKEKAIQAIHEFMDYAQSAFPAATVYAFGGMAPKNNSLNSDNTSKEEPGNHNTVRAKQIEYFNDQQIAMAGHNNVVFIKGLGVNGYAGGDRICIDGTHGTREGYVNIGNNLTQAIRHSGVTELLTPQITSLVNQEGKPVLQELAQGDFNHLKIYLGNIHNIKSDSKGIFTIGTLLPNTYLNFDYQTEVGSIVSIPCFVKYKGITGTYSSTVKFFVQNRQLKALVYSINGKDLYGYGADKKLSNAEIERFCPTSPLIYEIVSVPLIYS